MIAYLYSFDQMNKYIFSWEWSSGTTWGFYVSNDRLPHAYITSVFWLIVKDDKVLLTKHHVRGREMPGWHIESWETASTALKRELIEETGREIWYFEYVWYRKIHLSKKIYTSSWDLKYPFPESYIAYYLCTWWVATYIALATDVLDAQRFFIHDLPDMYDDVRRIILSLYELYDKKD